jgi:hypothetical protein
MRLQRALSPWGCLLASFAMVMEWDQKKVIERIVHDGSEIMFPENIEPFNRRSFHVQEIIPLCLEDGWSVTPIDSLPVSRFNDREVDVPISEGYAHRYQRLLEGRIGVISGRNNAGVPHAVAWDGGQCYDCNDGIYLPHLFQHQTFWTCNPIKR